MAEAEDYADDGGSTSSNGDGTTTEEDHRLHLGLMDSMTAKGIQHLCSELLEIKNASEQDFRANVYLSYLSFIRMFQEACALEKDLHQHVLAHRSLFQHLSNNHYDLYSSSSIVAVLGAAIPVAAADLHYYDEDELELELDVLLSEHRMEEALELLEQQGQALHGIATAEAIASSMSARKAKVADRFASIADNPRTPRPELLKALSGLCKLGDAQRANHLLFKFYRPASSQPFRNWKKKSSSNHIKDLARMVFSSILEASRSFVSLHGHPSPHTPQLMRWAREEIEDFSVAFSEYVESISSSQVGHQSSVVMALEAAKCALSYCSLLRMIVSEQDLLDLIAPCLEEVLTMYARHLKEVTGLFVASDTWVLGRFPVSGILARARSPATMAAGLQQIEYCLLTTSGRKFLTLIQDVVEEVYPLLYLRIDNSVLQLLAELFMEYMHSIVELIPKNEGVALQNEDHRYTWQLSILINCTTLVSLFPIIAHGAKFKSDQPSVVTNFLTQKGEVDSLILLIKEAAGQVLTCFCQQFIRDTMSYCCLQKSGEGIASSTQGMMPSFPFQVLFGRVRQLDNLYGNILTAKDGALKNLLQELMEAMIFWLSADNLESWIHHAQGVPRGTLLQQIQLDVHFLLEFMQLGGFSSENIRTGALDLLTKAQEKVANCSEHDNSNNSGGWATDAAKHAVGVLMAIGSSPHQEEASSVQNAQEKGEEKDQGHMNDEPEDHEDNGACDGGKSNDEFISIEEDDDEGDSMSSEELKQLGLGSNHRAVPDEYSVSDHPATSEVWKDHDEKNAEADDHVESGSGDSPAEIKFHERLHAAIEVEEDDVIGDNSCELVLQQDNTPIQETISGGGGSGRSRRRRQARTARRPPPLAAAARSSKRERGAVSSRPRWQ